MKMLCVVFIHSFFQCWTRTSKSINSCPERSQNCKIGFQK